MRYIIKEKIFSFANRFTINNENNEPVYEAVGKVFSLSRKLDLYDISGNHKLYIEQKLFRFLPEYTIYSEGRQVARVLKEFTFFKPKYTIDSKYGNFTIEGDIFAHEFNILRDGSVVAWISKQWISFSDTYTVDVSDEENQALILALVIVLDQIHHDNKN